jgi:hypothetical protein
MVTHTLQTMSEYERKHWVEAMGGSWPAISTLQRIRSGHQKNRFKKQLKTDVVMQQHFGRATTIRKVFFYFVVRQFFLSCIRNIVFRVPT